MILMRPLREGDSFPGLNPKEGLFYVALDGDTLLGFCRYFRFQEEIEILEIRDGGALELFDGLLRAVCGTALDSGALRARIGSSIEVDKLRKLSIPVDAMNCISSLDNFINTCKNCEKSKM